MMETRYYCQSKFQSQCGVIHRTLAASMEHSEELNRQRWVDGREYQQITPPRYLYYKPFKLGLI